MEKRKVYNEEELNALSDWFAARDLPPSLRLDQSTNIPDLRATLGYLLDQAEICYEKPRMQGAIRLLRRIKQELEVREREGS